MYHLLTTMDTQMQDMELLDLNLISSNKTISSQEILLLSQENEYTYSVFDII